MKRALALLLLFSLASCGKNEQPAPAPAPEQKQAAAPQLTPEQMMAKMKEAATPGEEHKRLAPLVGKFKSTATFWMEPGKPPLVEKGTTTNTWALGKRFVKQEHKSKFGGMPFQGTGYLGYDNVKKAYVGTWMDSMGTGILTSEGWYDAATKTLSMDAQFSCPLEGGPKKAKFITKILNNKEFVDEMYDVGPDGKEFKVMEIKYKKIG